MEEFLEELLSIIEESESTLNEIERVIYTNRYKLSKKHVDIFSVQTVSMIYSIWEGFIQKSFSLYVVELSKLRIPYMHFIDELIIFHMEATFKQLRNYPGKKDKKIYFYNQLKQLYSSDVFEFYPNINTESNVNFEVMNRLLAQFGLETFAEYWGEYTYPQSSIKDAMKSFINYRNGVSHGGDLSSEEKVTQDTFNKYKQLVLDLMNGIYDKFELATTEKTYLK